MASKIWIVSDDCPIKEPMKELFFSYTSGMRGGCPL